jgi:hypothetical protein
MFARRCRASLRTRPVWADTACTELCRSEIGPTIPEPAWFTRRTRARFMPARNGQILSLPLASASLTLGRSSIRATSRQLLTPLVLELKLEGLNGIPTT